MRQITIAIHTFPYALRLKHTLEEAGIEVALQNVNLEHPIVSPGVRVRIHEHDLAKALRIIEVPGSLIMDDDAMFNPVAQVLVPTDLSENSVKACRMALSIAAAHDTGVYLFHSFITPSLLSPPPLSDELDFDRTEQLAADELTDRNEEAAMHRFGERINNEIAQGKMPSALIEMKVTEGIPEEAIAMTAKEIGPLLIVMGTRAAEKKEREVIGSVTAEVLDTVRYPVLSLPENSELETPDDVKRIVYFATPDQQDIVAIDTMSRLMPLNKDTKVTIVNMPSRRFPTADTSALESLLTYCTDHYPRLDFSLVELPADDFAESLRKLVERHPADLFCIPNRRRGILSRIFNPTLAHRMLFKADMPILSIPV